MKRTRRASRRCRRACRQFAVAALLASLLAAWAASARAQTQPPVDAGTMNARDLYLEVDVNGERTSRIARIAITAISPRATARPCPPSPAA